MRQDGQPLLRLRPLGLGELLDDVFRIYRRHFWLLAGIAFVLTLPELLIQFVGGAAGELGFFLAVLSASSRGTPGPLATTGPPAGYFVALAAGYIVLLVMIPFIVGTITKAAIDLVQGRRTGVRRALGDVARRYWALLGLVILLALISPTLFCLPVGIWLYVRWAAAIPVLLEEGGGPIRALDRSWTLTRGNWWRTFGVLIVMALLQAAVSQGLNVLGLPLAVGLPFAPPILRVIIIFAVDTLATTVVGPLLYLTVVLLYFDLRIRQEHFDLDQLALLAGRAP